MLTLRKISDIVERDRIMEPRELDNIYYRMSSPNFDFSSLLPSAPEPPEINLPQGTELVPFPQSSLIYDKGDMYGKYSIQGEPSQVSEPEEIYPKNKAKHDNLIHSIDNEISSLIKLSENHLEILKETRKYFTNLKHTSKL